VRRNGVPAIHGEGKRFCLYLGVLWGTFAPCEALTELTVAADRCSNGLEEEETGVWVVATVQGAVQGVQKVVKFLQQAVLGVESGGRCQCQKGTCDGSQSSWYDMTMLPRAFCQPTLMTSYVKGTEWCADALYLCGCYTLTQ
jgi:hypothetical protein